MAIIIDGRVMAKNEKLKIAKEVAAMKRKPGLAVILVGDNPASRLYVNNKKKDCAECGIRRIYFASLDHRGRTSFAVGSAE